MVFGLSSLDGFDCFPCYTKNSRSQMRNLLNTEDTAYKSIPMLTFTHTFPTLSLIPALGEGGGRETLCLSLTGAAPVFIDTHPGIRAPTDPCRGVSVTTGVLEM